MRESGTQWIILGSGFRNFVTVEETKSVRRFGGSRVRQFREREGSGEQTTEESVRRSDVSVLQTP
jgi:hypothetical protein